MNQGCVHGTWHSVTSQSMGLRTSHCIQQPVMAYSNLSWYTATCYGTSALGRYRTCAAALLCVAFPSLAYQPFGICPLNWLLRLLTLPSLPLPSSQSTQASSVFPSKARSKDLTNLARSQKVPVTRSVQANRLPYNIRPIRALLSIHCS